MYDASKKEREPALSRVLTADGKQGGIAEL